MIKVKVKGIAAIGELIGPGGEKDVHLSSGSNIRDLIEGLLAECESSLADRIFSEDNSDLNERMRFLLNGQDLEFLNGIDTELKDGDRFSIIPLLSGG